MARIPLGALRFKFRDHIAHIAHKPPTPPQFVGNVGNQKQIAHIAHSCMCSRAVGSPHGASSARLRGQWLVAHATRHAARHAQARCERESLAFGGGGPARAVAVPVIEGLHKFFIF